jgi:cyclohexyl-isocyanide hydratase
MHDSRSLTVGMVLFPNLTQLDLTAPYEVFSRMSDTTVLLAAATLEPVRSERGLTITPSVAFDETPPLDVVCVPGGVGVNAMMEDEVLLRFLQTVGRQARYLTSVCTGSLLLGAAGLLSGYCATSHWMSLDLLPLFGALPVEERVVVDRNRITGGGVTAGIDLGLVVAAELVGPAIAQEIQLTLEYDPAPPFASGSPRTAPADVRERVIRSRRESQAERRAIAERAAARLARFE